MNILSLFPDPIQDPTLHGTCVGLTLKHQSGLNVEACLGPAILTADGGSEKAAGLPGLPHGWSCRGPGARVGSAQASHCLIESGNPMWGRRFRTDGDKFYIQITLGLHVVGNNYSCISRNERGRFCKET